MDPLLHRRIRMVVKLGHTPCAAKSPSAKSLSRLSHL